MTSLKPSTLRVLRALHAAGDRGATTHALCQPDVGGVRFGGRVFELRELGLRIDVRQERPGSYRYRLVENAASARLLPTDPPIGGALYRHPRLRGRWRLETAGPKWIRLRSLEVVNRGGAWSSVRVATEEWPGEWTRA